jgi:hypothetical protein
MGQNQAAASMVKKQMGHCTHKVSTLKNKGDTKNAMELKYLIQISYLQLCALVK